MALARRRGRPGIVGRDELDGPLRGGEPALIHRHIARKLGMDPILEIENHRNFAWKDLCEIEGHMREVIVHRKGATPAGIGVLGIIPGSMVSPGFVVRGKCSRESLCSASHGAGRVMSRTKALNSFTWSATRKLRRNHSLVFIISRFLPHPGTGDDVGFINAFSERGDS